MVFLIKILIITYWNNVHNFVIFPWSYPLGTMKISFRTVDDEWTKTCCINELHVIFFFILFPEQFLLFQFNPKEFSVGFQSFTVKLELIYPHHSSGIVVVSKQSLLILYF